MGDLPFFTGKKMSRGHVFCREIHNVAKNGDINRQI